jgi:hypothetical protein
MLRPLFSFGRKNRSSQRRAPALKPARPRRWQPCLEELEARCTPDCTVGLLGGQLIAQGDNMGNIITLDHHDDTTVLCGQAFPDARFQQIQINPGDGDNTITIAGTARPVAIAAGVGENTVNVGTQNSSLDNIRAPINISALETVHKTILNVNDCAAQPTSHTYYHFVVSALGYITRDGLFICSYDVTGTGRVNFTSGPGDDTVWVVSTARDVYLSLDSCGGTDTVNIGNNDNLSHGVQDIQGRVHVKNGPWYTSLNVNDGFDPAARTATLSVTGGGLGQIAGLAPALISYVPGDLNALNVTTGLGDDVVRVQSTAAGFPVTLDSHGGADTVRVGNSTNGVQSILGTLNVFNGPSRSNLIIDNCADPGDHDMEESLSAPGTPSSMAHIAILGRYYHTTPPILINFRANDVSSLTFLFGSGETFIVGYQAFDNGDIPDRDGIGDGFWYSWRDPNYTDCGGGRHLFGGYL